MRGPPPRLPSAGPWGHDRGGREERPEKGSFKSWRTAPKKGQERKVAIGRGEEKFSRRTSTQL